MASTVLAQPQAPVTWFVDSSVQVSGDGMSWTHAKMTIHEAIQAADEMDPVPQHIWVRVGNYKPTNALSSINLKPRIQVYGGFAGNEVPGEFDLEDGPRTFGDNGSIISGEFGVPGDYSDNAEIVVQCPQDDSDYRLDGFTIRDAREHGIYCYYFSSGLFRNLLIKDNVNQLNSRGAGMLIFDRCGPTLRDCTFENNEATGSLGGGGLAAISQCDVRLDDTKFINNRCDSGEGYTEGGGGVLISRIVVLRLRRCEFTDNRSTNGNGGALHASDESSVLSVDCRFINNHVTITDPEDALMFHGGGAHIQRNSALVNNQFLANSVRLTDLTPAGLGGGAHLAEESMFLTNCLFAQNSALAGGGLYVGTPDTDASHLTLTENVAFTIGAGLFIAQPSGPQTATFRNSIFWGNVGDPLASIEEQQIGVGFEPPIVEYGCVEDDLADGDAFPGAGNIDYDPAFYSPIITDYRVAVCSPVIDVGERALTPADVFNVDEDAFTTEEKTPDIDLNVRDVDVPLILTGAGYPPVDMGSYEFQIDRHGKFLLGDMNKDGVVNNLDAPLIAAVHSLYPPPGTPILSPDHALADMNQDGDIDRKLLEQDDLECFSGMLAGYGNLCEGVCYLGPILELSMAGSGVEDCNHNGIDDLADLSLPLFISLDCNDNGIIDSCDIASGVSADANGNGYPDECDAAVGILPTDDPVAEELAFERALLAALELQFYEWAITRPWGPGAGDPAAPGSAQFALIVDKRRELGLPLLNRWVIELP